MVFTFRDVPFLITRTQQHWYLPLKGYMYIKPCSFYFVGLTCVCLWCSEVDCGIMMMMISSALKKWKKSRRDLPIFNVFAHRTGEWEKIDSYQPLISDQISQKIPTADDGQSRAKHLIISNRHTCADSVCKRRTGWTKNKQILKVSGGIYCIDCVENGVGGSRIIHHDWREGMNGWWRREEGNVYGDEKGGSWMRPAALLFRDKSSSIMCNTILSAQGKHTVSPSTPPHQQSTHPLNQCYFLRTLSMYASTLQITVVLLWSFGPHIIIRGLYRMQSDVALIVGWCQTDHPFSADRIACR
jgi:hypothetical protein